MRPSIDVVVVGELAIESHLVRFGRAVPGNPPPMRLFREPAGAARLARLLAGVAGELRASNIEVAVRPVDAGAGAATELREQQHASGAAERISCTFFEWTREGKPPAWRVRSVIGREPGDAPPSVPRLDGADVIVVTADVDPGPLPPAAWVVCTLQSPVASGPFWHRLHDEHPDRVIVIVDADDLRTAEVQISRDLSWERTAQDAFWELVHNPRINGLARCEHVVITFDRDGALWLARREGGWDARLFFNPDGLERTWSAALPGSVPDGRPCIVSALAAAVFRAPERPDIAAAIQRGVAAMRDLQRDGWAAEPPETPVAFTFPYERIARVISGDARVLCEADVRDPQIAEEAGAAAWSILADRASGGLVDTAARIAIEGLDAVLRDVPVARFGHLVSIDRQEIESYRSVHALMAEYCGRPQKKPLSIAVFGAPGSGKSFGVTEIASSLRPGEIKVLEFNLSQLDGPDGLRSALHQVRDAALSGSIPLVFWDEFDTALDGRPLGWLRHFLAPMQDGRFLEGQIGHPIGKAIFVFAGGTAVRLAEFGVANPEAFRDAKGPDFVSRLRGAVDVLGPNPQPRNGADDPYFTIRRAVLLRGMMQRHAPHCFEGPRMRIDPGVLRAFLETRTFRHGARSMEAIVTMSSLSTAAFFERSCLPGEHQLDIHVDARDFLAIAQRLELTAETLERLARANHEVFSGSIASHDSQRAVPSFDLLPDDEKEQNRDAVRDIARKLSIAGYLIIPARSNEPEFVFPDGDVERLAEIEHSRWARLKIRTGWRWAENTDKEAKRHASLVSWSGDATGWADDERPLLGSGPLSDSEKEKDRDLVRHIPAVLRRAGYTVIRERGA